MNAVKISGSLIGALVLFFILRTLFVATSLWTYIQASPWWVFLLLGGIIVSGFLSFKYAKEEKDLEAQWIEQEGEAFMEPIRKRRGNKEMIN